MTIWDGLLIKSFQTVEFKPIFDSRTWKNEGDWWFTVELAPNLAKWGFCFFMLAFIWFFPRTKSFFSFGIKTRLFLMNLLFIVPLKSRVLMKWWTCWEKRNVIQNNFYDNKMYIQLKNWIMLIQTSRCSSNKCFLLIELFENLH